MSPPLVLLLLVGCRPGPPKVDPADTGRDTHADSVADTAPDSVADTDLDSDTAPPDADGDGARDDLDCDDTDASVYPGQADGCDGRDADCDGVVDEDGTHTAWDGWRTPETAEGPTDTWTYVLDLDGDGRLDLVRCRDRVRWALHPGGPWIVGDEWQATWSYQLLDGSCTDLDAADLDDDGDDDIVVLDGSTLFWLENDAGALGAPQELATGVEDGTTLGVGDFDGDGLPDIAAAPQVLWNDGGAVFSADRLPPYTDVRRDALPLLADGRSVLSGGGQALLADTTRVWSHVRWDDVCMSWPMDESAARVGDFDGDGHLDALVGGVELCYGDGAGNLRSDGILFLPTDTAWVTRLADADGDGWLDAVVNDESDEGPDLRLFFGDGVGFTPGQSLWLPSELHQDGGALWEDLDGDGAAELFAWDDHGDRWSLFPSDGAGFIENTVVDLADLTDEDAEASVADLDGDGVDEVVALSSDAAWIGTADGARGYTWSEAVALPSTFRTWIPRPGADFDGDGDEELVLVYPASYLVESDGVSMNALPVDFSDPPIAPRIWAPDLDGDGDAELVSENVAEPYTADYFTEEEVLWYGGLGEGYPTAFTDLLETVGTGTALALVADADLTGDGVVDLVTVDATGARVWAWDGVGLGLAASTDLDWAASATDLESRRGLGTGDADGDGDTDLWLALPDEGAVLQLLNDGVGGLTLGDRVPAPPAMVDDTRLRFERLGGVSAVARVMGDTGETWTWRYEGGTFEAIAMAVPKFGQDGALRDLDDDGAVDLVGATGDRVFVYWGWLDEQPGCEP